MSEIDKRVVELELDNSKFNRSINQTQSRMEDFKKSLNFDDVSNSLDKIQVKISKLDIAVMTIISNITTAAMNISVKLVKALSIDNVSSGWAKFEQKTKSVATIMSQTIRIAGREITDYAEKMESVNNQLDKLNWFTDQTSYNFTDMVDNIGKFTAAGQDLDKSVDAMMGIANWAALSGQNAETASRAMYQLAQAMSKGNVQLIDYKSIQNANMDTQEFRQTVLDTAVAMGELTKQGEHYLTKNGKKFTRNQFTETLSDKWFTADVLTSSLSKYSAAVDRLYELSEETGLTVAQVMARYSEEFDEFGLKAFKAAQEARTFTDTINAIKDAVSTGWLNTAEKIFGGYDESKVFWTELADSLYEVFAAGGDVRNQILGIWSTLKGREDLFAHDPNNPDKQGAFWNIYDAIVSVVDVVKTSFRQIFSMSDFSSTNEYVKDVGNKFKLFTKNLQESTKRFRDFISNNKLFSNSIKSIFGGLKVAIGLFKSAFYVLDPLFSTIKNFAANVLTNISNRLSNLSWIEKILVSITDHAIQMRDTFEQILDETLSSEIFTSLIDGIYGLFESLKNIHLLQKAGDIFKLFLSSFVQNGGNASNFSKIVNGITYAMHLLLNAMKNVATYMVNSIMPTIQKVFGVAFKILGAVLGKIVELLAAFFDELKNFSSKKKSASITDSITTFISSININKTAVTMADTFASILSSLKDTFHTILVIMSYMLPLINAIAKVTLVIVKQINNIVTSIMTKLSKQGGMKLIIIGLLVLLTTLISLFIVVLKTVKRFNGVMRSVQYAFEALAASFYATIFVKVSEALLVLAGAFYLLGKMDTKSLIRATVALNILAATLLGIYMFFYVLTDYSKGFDVKSLNKSINQLLKLSFMLIETSVAMLILSKAANSFASIKKDDFNNALVGLLGSFALLTGIILIFSKIKVKGMSQATKLASMTLILSASVLVISGIMKKMASIDWSTILFGSLKIAASITVLIAMFEFIQRTTGKAKGIISKLIVIDLMALSINYIANKFTKMINTLNSINWIELISGIGKIAILLGVSIAMFKVLEISNIQGKILAKIIGISITLSILASSLKLMATNLNYIGSIPFSNIMLSLLNLSSILLILYGLTNIKIKPVKIIAVSISIDILSIALMSMAISLLTLSAIPFTSTLKALLSVISMLGLIFVMTEMKLANPIKIFAMATSMMMLGMALSTYATGLSTLANVPFSSLFKGLLTLVAGFTILAIVSKLLKPEISTILGVSFAVLVLGGALLIVAYALESLSSSFDMNVQSMWETLTQFLYGLLDFVQVNIGKICEVIGTVIVAILKTIEDILPQLAKTVTKLILAVLQVIRDTAPDLLLTVAFLISEILKMLKDNIGQWTLDVVEILIKFIDALTEKLPELIRALGDFLQVFIVNSLSDLSRRLMPILNALISFVLKLIQDLGRTIKNRAKDFAHTFIEFGINLMEGLKIGIVEGLATIIEKIPTIGKTIANGFRAIFGIHSPSTVMMEMGRYLDEGLAKGVKDNIGETSDSMSDSMSKVLGAVNDTLNSEIDDSIVLTPVLDTSNIQNGVRNINDMMNGINGNSLSVSGRYAASASNEINRNSLANQAPAGTINNTSSNDNYYFTFNVETNDPEELARQTDIILQKNKYKSSLAKGG